MATPRGRDGKEAGDSKPPTLNVVVVVHSRSISYEQIPYEICLKKRTRHCYFFYILGINGMAVPLGKGVEAGKTMTDALRVPGMFLYLRSQGNI